jgi:lipopolysaccharide export system protein LptA
MPAKHHRNILKVILTLIILGGVTGVAAGASSPQNSLPIQVNSNAATVNLQQGVAVYSGNVTAVQGTRKLAGDALTVTRGSDGNLKSMMAQGSPAKTQEKPSPTAKVAYGEADRIYYLPGENLVKYVNHANFTQGGNVFSGDLITYNTVTQVISSPKVPGSGNGTTTIIFPAYDKGSEGS